MKEEKQRLVEIINTLKNNDIISGLTPIKLRKILEELGPTFIKIGQILSFRTDLIPKEYCDELTQLRSNVKPMTLEEVEQILQEEYGDYKKIFISIDENPIGSASIAQVHKATLKNGNKVVLKIQRKNIDNKMYLDTELMKKAIKTLHINHFANNIINIEDCLDEIYNSAKEEMNFINEMARMEEFRNNNKEVIYIKVPKVYKNITTMHILVMEYINGCAINDKKVLNELGYDINEVANKLSDNYVKQAIYDGLFQADPHSDNFKIQNGKIVYLDFGMFSTINTRERNLLKECIKNIVNNDMYGVSEVLIRLSGNNKINHKELTKQINTILDKYASSSLEEMSCTSFFNDMFKCLSENEITLPKNITMLIRGITVIEGLLKDISPKISLLQVLTKKVEEEEMKKLVSLDVTKKTVRELMTTTQSMSKIPNELLTFVRTLNDGETKFSIELNNSNKQVDKLEVMLHELIIGLLDVAFILGASLVNDSKSLRNVYLAISLLLSVWLFIKMFKDHITKGM